MLVPARRRATVAKASHQLDPVIGTQKHAVGVFGLAVDFLAPSRTRGHFILCADSTV